MNSIKIAALIVGAIALFPSVSLADNFSGNVQEANLNSTIIGNGNLVVTDTTQSSINFQNYRSSGTNFGGNSQRVNANTVVVGDNNTDIKRAIQNALHRQN